MTKNDTWPGGVAMESLSNMDSAGSCESVISMNSGYVSAAVDRLMDMEGGGGIWIFDSFTINVFII